jgi:hypothetical protein
MRTARAASKPGDDQLSGIRLPHDAGRSTAGGSFVADMPIYEYVPHNRTRQKLEGAAVRPVRALEQFPRGNAAARFNGWLAVRVTKGVGTMWCAYAFAALALVSLPSAIASHSAVTLVSWISQTFLQLVLLSVIIVGQNVLADAADKRAEATYNDADAILHEAVKLQEHLLAQDKVLAGLKQQIQARS